MTETRFAFGRNWADYAGTVGEAELGAAEAGLRRLLPDDFDPDGHTLLDIGSGSGLHAVAAVRLGFERVTATDYDADAVATTQRVARSFGVEAKVDAFRDDILNGEIAERFDVVYSWGVLHHTGDMWRAIDAAAARVGPRGLLIIAIYRLTAMCGLWRRIKYLYCNAPKAVQTAMVYGYLGALGAGRPIVRLRQGRSLRERSSDRGMKRWYDAVDWLGGYPYQSARPQAVIQYLADRFELQASVGADVRQVGLGGSGCAEFVFRRPA